VPPFFNGGHHGAARSPPTRLRNGQAPRRCLAPPGSRSTGALWTTAVIAKSLNRADRQPQRESTVDPDQAARGQPTLEARREPARHDGEVDHRGHGGHRDGVGNSRRCTGASIPATAPRVDARPQQRRRLVNHRPDPRVSKGGLIVLQRFVAPQPMAWGIQCRVRRPVVDTSAPREKHAGEQPGRQTARQRGSDGALLVRGVRHGGSGDGG
jgi:hypothetical protein